MFTRHRWFHPNLTTEDAKKLLLTKEDGSFLSYLSQASGFFIIAVRLVFNNYKMLNG